MVIPIAARAKKFIKIQLIVQRAFVKTHILYGAFVCAVDQFVPVSHSSWNTLLISSHENVYSRVMAKKILREEISSPLQLQNGKQIHGRLSHGKRNIFITQGLTYESTAC